MTQSLYCRGSLFSCCDEKKIQLLGWKRAYPGEYLREILICRMKVCTNTIDFILNIFAGACTAYTTMLITARSRLFVLLSTRQKPFSSSVLHNQLICSPRGLEASKFCPNNCIAYCLSLCCSAHYRIWPLHSSLKATGRSLCHRISITGQASFLPIQLYRQHHP